MSKKRWWVINSIAVLILAAWVGAWSYQAWYKMNVRSYLYRDLKLTLPDNWRANKDENDVVVIRVPLNTGMFRISFQPRVDSYKVMKFAFETEPMVLASAGKGSVYDFVEDVKIDGSKSLLAYSLIDNEYHAAVAIPDRKLLVSYIGGKDGYHDFLEIMNRASFIENADADRSGLYRK